MASLVCRNLLTAALIAVVLFSLLASPSVLHADEWVRLRKQPRAVQAYARLQSCSMISRKMTWVQDRPEPEVMLEKLVIHGDHCLLMNRWSPKLTDEFKVGLDELRSWDSGYLLLWNPKYHVQLNSKDAKSGHSNSGWMMGDLMPRPSAPPLYPGTNPTGFTPIIEEYIACGKWKVVTESKEDRTLYVHLTSVEEQSGEGPNAKLEEIQVTWKIWLSDQDGLSEKQTLSYAKAGGPPFSTTTITSQYDEDSVGRFPKGAIVTTESSRSMKSEVEVLLQPFDGDEGQFYLSRYGLEEPEYLNTRAFSLPIVGIGLILGGTAMILVYQWIHRKDARKS